MDADVPEDAPIVLFDGVCNLCNGYVQFLLERDDEGVFHFASLQSEVAKQLLAAHDRPTDALESIVLIEGDESYGKSDAVLRIAKRLGGVYALLWPFRFVPRWLRDRAYDLVANRRYRLFGKRDRCMVPDDDVASRFLE